MEETTMKTKTIKRRKHFTTKNNHNGSRKRNLNSFIVDPTGNLKPFNGYITKEQADDNEKAVLNFIDKINKIELNPYDPEAREYCDGITMKFNPKYVSFDAVFAIMEKMKESKCGDQYEHGTAMFPMTNNVWVIGSLGSIWLDVLVESVSYRVAFYNEKPYPEILIYPN